MEEHKLSAELSADFAPVGRKLARFHACRPLDVNEALLHGDDANCSSIPQCYLA